MTNLCYNIICDTSYWNINLYGCLIDAKTDITCFFYIAKKCHGLNCVLLARKNTNFLSLILYVEIAKNLNIILLK